MAILFLFLLVATVFANCPTGYTYYASNQKCYKVVEEQTTYFGAAAACALDDGQLVSIHNAFENAYVASLVENNSTDHWIGLTTMISGSNFTWLDNSAFNYDDFSPSPPNKNYNCTAMKPATSTWLTFPCAYPLPFICVFDPTAIRTCPECPTNPPCPTCSAPPVCSTGAPVIEELSFEGNLDVTHVCPTGYTYVSIMQRCYKVVNETKTFFAAANACNLDDADLASIHGPQEGQTIGALLPPSDFNNLYWIGLTNLVNTWGQWTWLDGTSVLYANWAYGRPDNSLGCTVMHSISNLWTSDACQVSLPYICEFDPTKDHNCPPCATPTSCPVCPTYAPCPKPICDDGWKYFDSSDSCYFLGAELTNNTVAQTRCRQKDSYLASIHSDAENSFILNYIEDSIRTELASIWMGLYRIAINPNVTDFQNYDGTPVDYTHWAPSRPNNPGGDQFCTVMQVNFEPSFPNGTWDDFWCYNAIHHYMCKKPSNKN